MTWTANVLLALSLGLASDAGAAMPHLEASSLGIEQTSAPAFHDVGVDDLLGLRDLQGLFVSPDGRSAATLLNAPDVAADSYRIAWFVVSTTRPGPGLNVGDAGEPGFFDGGHRLDGTPGRNLSLTARWSPDSRFIGYLRATGGEVQVWRSARAGGAPKQLTHSRADVINFYWSQRGNWLIYSTGASREELEAAARLDARDGFLVGPDTNWSYPHARPVRPRLELLDGKPRIWVLDLDSGETRRADQAEQDAYAARAAAEGSAAAETVPAPAGDWNASLRLVDPAQAARLPPRVLSVSRGGGPELSCGEPCQGAFATPDVFDGVAPMWWRPDGKALYFRRQNGLNRPGFSLFEWVIGSAAPREILASRDTVTSCTPRARRLVCLRQSPTTPREVVSYDLDTGKATTLFDPNPQWSSVRMGDTSWISWEDREGNPTYGVLIKPLNYVEGRRYPLVLIGYNTSNALRGDAGARFPAHVLAANGMVTLVYNLWSDETIAHRRDIVPNTYRAALKGVAYRQLDAVIDRLAGEGLVDPVRVGVAGFSNGLNPAAYGLIHGDRFKVAALGWLRWNPTSYYANRDPFSRLLDAPDLVGPMDQPASALIRNLSLAYNAKAVRAPILVQTSDSEFIRLAQMEALRRFADAGRPLEMHVFPDEEHLFFHPAHREAEYRRSLQWFQFWLLGTEALDPLDPDQFIRWRSYRDQLSGGPASAAEPS